MPPGLRALGPRPNGDSRAGRAVPRGPAGARWPLPLLIAPVLRAVLVVSLAGATRAGEDGFGVFALLAGGRLLTIPTLLLISLFARAFL